MHTKTQIDIHIYTFLSFISVLHLLKTHTTTSSQDRLWRKNRAPSSVPECFGVDLNRNFDFYWGGEGTATCRGNNMSYGSGSRRSNDVSNRYSKPELSCMLFWERSGWLMFIRIHCVL